MHNSAVHNSSLFRFEPYSVWSGGRACDQSGVVDLKLAGPIWIRFGSDGAAGNGRGFRVMFVGGNPVAVPRSTVLGAESGVFTTGEVMSSHDGQHTTHRVLISHSGPLLLSFVASRANVIGANETTGACGTAYVELLTEATHCLS